MAMLVTANVRSKTLNRTYWPIDQPNAMTITGGIRLRTTMPAVPMRLCRTGPDAGTACMLSTRPRRARSRATSRRRLRLSTLPIVRSVCPTR